MSARAESKMTNMFEQAFQSFGDAMKAGVKMQEEVARWWTDALEQGGPVQESQKRFRAMVTEAIPAAQKSAEEWMKIAEQNYDRSVNLLKKAFDSNGSSPTDIQARMRDMWEASMAAVRESAQAMTEANVKTMELWTGMVRKNINAGPATKVAVK